MKKAIVFFILSLFSTAHIWAQGCVMCSKTAESLGTSGAQQLNTGILYLAAIPIAFVGTISFLWLKHSKKNS
ncbi:MAG TPA: hypothetical protein PKX92_07020 [Edaphocola sp.]|nr:hypothetical protein [Edaphocola sp.]